MSLFGVLIESFLPCVYLEFLCFYLSYRSVILEILIKCLKSNNSSVQLKLFHDLLKLPFEKAVKLNYKAVPNECIIIHGKDGILLKSRDDVDCRKESECVEELGLFIVKLLTDLNLTECKLIGPVFISCMNSLISLLTIDSNVSSNNKELLIIKHAATGVVHSTDSTLLLFVAAALCETIGEKLLDEVDIPSLVRSLVGIIKCHANYAKENDRIKVKPDCTSVVGGHVTLSIAFGLLSAILTLTKEVIYTYCICNILYFTYYM